MQAPFGPTRAPILVLCAATFVGFALAVPGFASTVNVSGIVIASLPLLLLATGQTFVLVSGGIDLSAPAIVGLVSVVGGLVMSAVGHRPAGTRGERIMSETRRTPSIAMRRLLSSTRATDLRRSRN